MIKAIIFDWGGVFAINPVRSPWWTKNKVGRKLSGWLWPNGYYYVYPEMLELATQLKQRYRTMLLSNITCELMLEIKKKYQVEKYFHQTIFSYEVRLDKPNQAMFQLASQRLDIAPSETILIDNEPENIATAKTLGYQTILFGSPAQLIATLTQLINN